ncbi:MAG: PfkB family carbohydrate kinase [Campylobacterales bacterium]
MKYKKIVVFGEILYDVFEDRKRLGGAPFNVAYNCYMMGADVLFLSSIGRDKEGLEIEEFFNKSGFDSSCVKRLNNATTGRVEVVLKDKEPTYNIVDGVAYDYIDTCLEEIDSDDILYAGTLALRHKNNQNSFKKLISTSENLFLDVNLREPFYSRDVLELTIGAARWLKINYDELYVIKKMFNLVKDDHIELCYELKKAFDIEKVILTMGEKGAMSIASDVSYAEAKKVQNFVDSVGAGDAFSSVYIAGLKEGREDEAKLLDDAASFSAKVCTLRGAITSSRTFYKEQGEVDG